MDRICANIISSISFQYHPFIVSYRDILWKGQGFFNVLLIMVQEILGGLYIDRLAWWITFIFNRNIYIQVLRFEMFFSNVCELWDQLINNKLWKYPMCSWSIRSFQDKLTYITRDCNIYSWIISRIYLVLMKVMTSVDQ